MTFSVY